MLFAGAAAAGSGDDGRDVDDGSDGNASTKVVFVSPFFTTSAFSCTVGAIGIVLNFSSFSSGSFPFSFFFSVVFLLLLLQLLPCGFPSDR